MLMKRSHLRLIMIPWLWLLCSCGRIPAHNQDEDSTTESSTTPDTASTPSQTPTSTSATDDRLPAISAGSVARPTDLCGQPGFTYLLSDYFLKNCGSCHGNDDLASPHPDVAYTKMLLVNDEKLRQVVTNGQFCTGACRITPTSQTYLDIVAWQQQKSECP